MFQIYQIFIFSQLKKTLKEIAAIGDTKLQIHILSYNLFEIGHLK